MLPDLLRSKYWVSIFLDHFATDITVDSFCVALDTHLQLWLQPIFVFYNSILACRITPPDFHFPNTFYLYLSSVYFLLYFPQSKQTILLLSGDNSWRTTGFPGVSQGSLAWDPVHQIPDEKKICFPEVQVLQLAFFQDLEPPSNSHCNQGCHGLSHPKQFFICKLEVQQSTFPGVRSRYPPWYLPHHPPPKNLEQ